MSGSYQCEDYELYYWKLHLNMDIKRSYISKCTPEVGKALISVIQNPAYICLIPPSL